MIGNALEWYDYALYAQFAFIIGQQFFPDSKVRDILVFAVFAAGFIVRPLGAIVLGSIGDKFGRRIALTIGILAMAIPTAGIGVLPTYEVIGLGAPIILTLFRLVQGFSLGGEFSGCIAYMVEHALPKNRGLIGSFSFVSMCMGILLGVVTANIFLYCMPENILFSWGWRCPFVVGLFIGVIGFYIRTHLLESPLYIAAKKTGNLSKYPFWDLLTQYWPQFLLSIGIFIAATAPFHTLTVYIENYMQSLGYERFYGSFATITILMTMIIIIPVSSAVSDKFGRYPVLISGVLAIISSSYPVFLALESMNYGITLLSLVIFAGAVAFYLGPIPTTLVEIFPTKVRFTGVALSYNLSAAMFGGSAPMIAIMLTKNLENKYAFSFYLIFLGLLSFISLLNYKETYKKNLSTDLDVVGENVPSIA